MHTLALEGGGTAYLPDKKIAESALPSRCKCATPLGSVTKNQQSGGGAWQAIGTYNFTAGWNKVVVSRWTTEARVRDPFAFHSICQR